MRPLCAIALCATLLIAPATSLAAAPRRDTVLTVKRPANPEWFGLYLVGKKAGWLWMQVSRERRDGVDVLVAKQEMFIQAALAGRQVARRQRDERVYQARPGGRLLSFTSEREGDGGNRRIQLSCTPQACRAQFAGNGANETRDLPPTAETAEQADPARLAAARKETVIGTQLDPERLREKKMQDTYERRTTLAGAGVTLTVSVVSESSDEDRVPARVFVADDGRIVEVRFGESLVAKAESEEVAKRLDRVDLFNLSRVSLPGPLPRTVPGSIVFQIRGLPTEFQKADSRQSYVPGPEGEVRLTVTARQPTAIQIGTLRQVAPTTQPQEFLQATPEIDADAPAISKLAREIVGDSPGVFSASTKLVHFVYQRLEKVYGQSHDRASEVLRFGKGDCTEHALLFVALARAAGIPARGVHGLVFAEYDDRVPALYWHAWAEVQAGVEWIAVDPTFDQPVADATHITLGRGTQVDSVGLLGALTVVEAKQSPEKP